MISVIVKAKLGFCLGVEVRGIGMTSPRQVPGRAKASADVTLGSGSVGLRSRLRLAFGLGLKWKEASAVMDMGRRISA